MFVFLLTLASCQDTVQEKPRVRAPLEGIKIGDLIPKDTEKMPSAINLKIYTFHIPVSNYEIMSVAFNALTKDKIRFSNYNSFNLNGFETGLGNAKLWKLTGDTLKKANAKRVNIKSLIVYDDLGDDFLTSKLSLETSVSHFALNGSKTETKLPPGFIGWRIKAHTLPERRGTAQLKVQGIYKQFYDNMFSRLPNFHNGDITFKPLSFVMNMNERDFFILGPDPQIIPTGNQKNENTSAISQTETAIERLRLADIFFKTTSNIILPVETDKTQSEKDQAISTPTTYRRAENVEVYEIYLIVCAGVEN